MGKAKLIKRKTEDGLVEIKDNVPLGKIYSVYSFTKKKQTLYNTEKNITHTKETIMCENGGWIATELLEFLPHD